MKMSVQRQHKEKEWCVCARERRRAGGGFAYQDFRALATHHITSANTKTELFLISELLAKRIVRGE
jgi:hypothetical protein